MDLLCGTGETGDCISVNSYVSNQSKILQEAYHQVQVRMGLQQDRQKEVYDRRRHGEPYKEGDCVMLYNPVIPHGHSKKLHRFWCGPFRVLKRLSEVTYRIHHCQGGRKRIVVHFNRLKLCPTTMRSEVQPSQDSSPGQIVRHPVRTGNPKATVTVPGTSAGEGTVIVDMDETLEGQEAHTRDLEHFQLRRQLLMKRQPLLRSLLKNNLILI